ncbi:fungal-specific transcription factor domain-containing protein [Ilyonectria robusta]|uniref:fungal-specific transcription factor domain-containing protein n=1 Tax=Ilyonectria robusta TaxID=1079257 RepID=UPI001E8E9ECC|nr:fungal-specific transcription factor domain-containing protein [Ilyonectria robusta]KAH8667181.1 fungal-specific transcription factor domain-containing protein [Ilyonectria robusta]
MQEAQQRRRQQRKACDLCRRRKVRCDIVVRGAEPCTVCEKAGLECRSTTKFAAPRRSLTNARRRSFDNNVRERSPSGVSRRDVDRTGEGEPSSLPPLTRAASTPLVVTQVKHTEEQTPRSGGQEQLARNGLARFFRHGIGAAAWTIFNATQSFRIAYVGTAVSNLVHLVDLHRSFRQPYASAGGIHRPLSAAAAQETPLDNPGTGSSSVSDTGAVTKPLHYPYPPIRQPKPWKPNCDIWGIPSAQDLASEVASFPAHDVRDALVLAYFEHIHPFLPIVSMPEFFDSYRSPDKPPPLLLFQAVLMAGAHACSHPLVANDRHAVKNVLFRRASMLYHMRHETDRMHLMQAAALFTWHVGDGDTVAGGPWYWSGIALRIGLGLGTHRHSKHLPQTETSQYRRCWWSVFVCEVFSSLETGRPCAVRAEDIDQLPLCNDDMTDTPGPTTITLGKDARPDFLNRMVELAYIGLDIMAVNAPSQEKLIDISSINARLGLWSLQSGISSVAENDDSWTCHLRMHYNLVLLHLYRNMSTESSSQSICSTAAQAIVTSLEQLAARDEMRQCHFTAVSAVTAVGIQFASEIRTAVTSGVFLVAISALEQLARLLRSTMLLSRYWPNAEAVHNVFEELHQEYEHLVTQHLQGERVIIPESPPDWNRLLAGEPIQPLNDFGADQGWMNIANWTDML